MATIFDYIATMDASVVESPIADGICVFPLGTSVGTATCGVVGIASLPVIEVEGEADWAPLGIVPLPVMDAVGSTDGYRPAWGNPALPMVTGEGTAHANINSVSLLPPLYAVGSTGAVGATLLPATDSSGAVGAVGAATLSAITSYGVNDGFNRTASGASFLPLLAAESYVCGIDNAINTSATSAAVVALLQQGNMTLADAAAAICAYDDTDDDRAMSVTYFVSNLMAYVQDSASGIGDRWTCALATWLRRYGDCEDGAILIHSLLLAAGVNPNRIRTAFGKVLTSELTEGGHAWCMYRRASDEEWIPLEWTIQPTPYTGTVDAIRRQVDLTGTYPTISHILTNEVFYAVNDSNYIAKLAKITSSGVLTLPALTIASTTSLSARGDLVLFKGLFGSTIEIVGYTGAAGVMALPSLRATGRAGQVNVARGEWMLPALACEGGAGAVGVFTLPRMAATGRCGVTARGAWTLPALALSGVGTTHAFAVASLVLPALAATGVAQVGEVLGGDFLLPSLVATGRASQGPLARGSLVFPCLQACGQATVLFLARGEWTLPPLAARGRAINVAEWVAGLLEYDPRRW